MNTEARAAFARGDLRAAACYYLELQMSMEQTCAEALAERFPHAVVGEDDGYAFVTTGDLQVSLQPDPEGGFRATLCRLVFAGTVAGRTPDEALAGLELP